MSKQNTINTATQYPDHERFLHAITTIVAERLTEEEREKLSHTKLLYGVGTGTAYGVTYFNRWENGRRGELIEICASAETGPIQLAETLVHELGHVVAGYEAAHGREWKLACERLGLRLAKAVGATATLAIFTPDVREKLAAIPTPGDGTPLGRVNVEIRPRKPGRCTTTIGVKGGTSRGKGSGSRLLKVECNSCGCNVRMTRKWIDSSGLPTCGCGGSMTEA